VYSSNVGFIGFFCILIGRNSSISPPPPRGAISREGLLFFYVKVYVLSMPWPYLIPKTSWSRRLYALVALTCASSWNKTEEVAWLLLSSILWTVKYSSRFLCDVGCLRHAPPTSKEGPVSLRLLRCCVSRLLDFIGPDEDSFQNFCPETAFIFRRNGLPPKVLETWWDWLDLCTTTTCCDDPWPQSTIRPFPTFLKCCLDNSTQNTKQKTTLLNDAASDQ
jgi:hypothetical protein